ncbi:hypothetical protein ACLOAU_03285 [Niabella sp. CJ426]|uniref:hypothetical protein n=1 Tax=Niabella sp. CJ426 TaxID=3393740 RepID=UPI003D085288
MIRYWLEFDFNDYMGSIPAGLHLGCGITAFSSEHALALLKSKVFKDEVLPRISKCISNVNIKTLNQGHIVSNMKPPVYIGIWFPLGYD